MWYSLVALLLVFLLPGASVTWARLRWEREQVCVVQAAIEAVLISVAISSILMLILLELRHFDVPMLLVALGVISLVAWGVGAIRPAPRNQIRMRLQNGGPLLAALVFFSILAFPPFNYTIGATDPGMYVVGGHLIARTGHIHAEVPTIAETPPGLFWKPTSIISPTDLPSWLRSSGGRIPGRYEGVWTSAMFVTNAETGRVVPQFLHLWMLWIAFSISLFGGAHSVALLPVLATLSALSLYGTATELFEEQRAALWILLLVLGNWTFIYFARLPVSEMMTLCCLAGGIWALARLSKTNSLVHACLAGLLLGLSLFARLDFLYQAPALGALFAYLFLTRRIGSRWYAFYVTLALLATWAFVHNLSYSYPYTFSHLCYVGLCDFLQIRYAPVILAGSAAAIASLFFLRHILELWLQRRSAPARQWKILGSVLLATLFTASTLYAFLPGFRVVVVKGVASDWTANESVLRFALAVGLPALLLGAAGACKLLRNRGEEPVILFLVLLLAQVWVFHGIFRPSWLVVPYGLRYYLTDLTPLLLFFAGWMVADLVSRISRPVWRSSASMALGLAILTHSVTAYAPMASYEGMHKAFGDLQALAAQIEPGGIVLFDSRHPVRAFQSPLFAAFGVESHTLSGVDEDESQRLVELDRWLSETHRPVYLVADQELEEFAGLRVDEVYKGVLTATEIEQTGQYRHLRIRWKDWKGHFSLYRLKIEEAQYSGHKDAAVGF